METGGLVACSKYKQLSQLSKDSIPITCYFPGGTVMNKVLIEIRHSGLSFPLIVKPDMGERGNGVYLVQNEEELKKAVDAQKLGFLVQQYMDYPFEAAVFVIKLPQKEWQVVSITTKAFLNVHGDGVSTVAELLQKNIRAQIAGSAKLPALVSDHRVPAKGEKIMVQPIGNHNRGTAFIDSGHLLNGKITQEAARLASQIDGFYYGRFDLRSTSQEDFIDGKNWKILEVNGVNAEPTHVYMSGFSFYKAWKTMLIHWKWIELIARENIRQGKRPDNFRKFMQYWHLYVEGKQ